jgi:hypothetical protein
VAHGGGGEDHRIAAQGYCAATCPASRPVSNELDSFNGGLKVFAGLHSFS